MLPRNNSDRMQITFDDHRRVANADLLLPATLAQHLGVRELVDHHLDLRGAPRQANTGDEMPTLVASALAGGDGIDQRSHVARQGPSGPFSASLGQILTPASIRSQPSPPDKPPWASIYRWKDSATVLL